MKYGYYFKLAGKWHRLEANKHFELEDVSEMYWTKNHFWQYSNNKVMIDGKISHFNLWKNKAPPEEDLTILEMMFP